MRLLLIQVGFAFSLSLGVTAQAISIPGSVPKCQVFMAADAPQWSSVPPEAPKVQESISKPPREIFANLKKQISEAISWSIAFVKHTTALLKSAEAQSGVPHIVEAKRIAKRNFKVFLVNIKKISLSPEQEWEILLGHLTKALRKTENFYTALNL